LAATEEITVEAPGLTVVIPFIEIVAGVRALTLIIILLLLTTAGVAQAALLVKETERISPFNSVLLLYVLLFVPVLIPFFFH
jgi:hypothetical protein